jgi:hypothetical protein
MLETESRHAAQLGAEQEQIALEFMQQGGTRWHAGAFVPAEWTMGWT